VIEANGNCKAFLHRIRGRLEILYMKVRAKGAVSRITYLVVILLVLILVIAAGLTVRELQLKQSSTSSITSSTTSSTETSTSSSDTTADTTTSTITTGSSNKTTSSSFEILGYNGCADSSNEISGFTCSSLAQDAQMWKPVTNGTLGFSVVLVDASYDYLEQTSQSTLQEELNMLLASGAGCIRIDIGYDAWLTDNMTAQNELQKIASQIHSAGKCLVIADAGAESYRSSPLPWTQFQAAWLQRVSTLSKLFQPNYYIAIKELSWYAPMISDASTNSQVRNATVWSELTGQLASEIQSVSPQTKVGVAIEGGLSQSEQPYYVNFLRGVSALNDISFIGFDPYGQSDLTLFQSIESEIQTSKNIWIAEAWSTGVDPSTGAPLMFNPDRASLDAYWIQIMYYYSLYIHASVLEPFYTDAFASYTQPPDFSQRTLVFYWFQHLASNFGESIS